MTGKQQLKELLSKYNKIQIVREYRNKKSGVEYIDFMCNDAEYIASTQDMKNMRITTYVITKGEYNVIYMGYGGKSLEATVENIAKGRIK